MQFAPEECLVRDPEKTMMATVFKGVGKPPVFERVPRPKLVRPTGRKIKSSNRRRKKKP
jgi:hypothetical protein